MARGTARRKLEHLPVIEFCVSGQPVSAQTRRLQALQTWMRRVSDAGHVRWPGGQTPLEGDLVARITFYSDRRIGDVDNLAKPILDALQAIVYADDRQVSDVLANRRDINARFRIRHISLPLAEAFSKGEQFVHIRVRTY